MISDPFFVEDIGYDMISKNCLDMIYISYILFFLYLCATFSYFSDREGIFIKKIPNFFRAFGLNFFGCNKGELQVLFLLSPTPSKP